MNSAKEVIENLIGNTNTILIKNNVYLKCEWQNLTGTPKTRFVNHRISRLQSEGVIYPGMTLYDVSTGSEAAALAQFGKLLGYNVEVWLPDYVAGPFAEYIEMYGARVNFVDKDDWLLEGSKKAREFANKDNNGFYFNQADALEDAISAYSKIGEELSNYFRLKNVTPEALVSVIGSGGLLLGTSLGLKKNFPKMKIYAVELNEAPFLHSSIHNYVPKAIPHSVWGISCEGSTRMKKELEKIVDDVLLFDEETMKKTAEIIPKELGISIDYPTSGNLLGAEKLLSHNDISQIVTVWTGHGWRTLLKKIF